MGVIRLRLPESLHKTARKMADQENISVNQLITLAVAEKISALMTAEELGRRMRPISRQKFRRAMNKVPAVEPEARDRL